MVLFLVEITVPINSKSLKHIRVFPISKSDDHPKLRSNFTYDVKMAISEKFRLREKASRSNFMCGYMDECGPETETGRIFYSPPRPDQKKLLTAPIRPELNLSFAPRPASPGSEFHLCSPAPPRPDLSFTFAPRPAPIRKELLPAPLRPDSRRYIYFSKI